MCSVLNYLPCMWDTKKLKVPYKAPYVLLSAFSSSSKCVFFSQASFFWCYQIRGNRCSLCNLGIHFDEFPSAVFTTSFNLLFQVFTNPLKVSFVSQVTSNDLCDVSFSTFQLPIYLIYVLFQNLPFGTSDRAVVFC